MKNNNNCENLDFQVKSKEIDLVQSIINRMSSNQMKVKGLCLVIVGFLITLLTNNSISTYRCLTAISFTTAALLATYSCYKLDYNFLKTEKLYRMWFEFLIDVRSETKTHLFELNPKKIKKILETEMLAKKEYNPTLLNKNTKNSWSLGFYTTILCIVVLCCLPTLISTFAF